MKFNFSENVSFFAIHDKVAEKYLCITCRFYTLFIIKLVEIVRLIFILDVIALKKLLRCLHEGCRVDRESLKESKHNRKKETNKNNQFLSFIIFTCIRNEEGERNNLLEELQKAAAAAAIAKDSDCGESISSPGSSTSCHASSMSSPATSGVASGSDNEEPQIKMEITEEPVDIREYIPKQVRENRPILKPQPKKELISFAKLLQTDNLKPLAYGVEPMDTTSGNESSERCITTGVVSAQGGASAKTELQMGQCAHLSRTSQSPGLDSQSTEQKPYSPISVCDSPASSGDSSVDSPTSFSFTKEDSSTAESGRARLTGVPEVDDTLFQDLLEITKNDTVEQLTADDGTVGEDPQKFRFSVNSPGNMSQNLGSPCASSKSPGPRLSSTTDGMAESVMSPRTPVKSDQLPQSGILAGLLNSCEAQLSCVDVTSLGSAFNKTPANQTMLSMTVTKIDPTMAAAGGEEAAILPDDIADFSLDFCRSVMDQTANDILTMSGNLDMVQSFDDTVIANHNGTTGPTITEISDNVVPSSQPCAADNLATTQPLSNMAATPVLQSEAQSKIQTKYPIPVNIPVPSNHSMGAPSNSPTVHEPMNVTDRISKLDITDRRWQQQQPNHVGQDEKTPLLHALLTGKEQNPVATPSQAAHSAPVENGMEGQSLVDSFDLFLQNMNNGGAQGEADTPVTNNNVVNQDNLTTLQQQHEKKKLMLKLEHQKEQERLCEQQRIQDQIMENEYEQLVQQTQTQELHRRLETVNRMCPVRTNVPQQISQQVRIGMSPNSGPRFASQHPQMRMTNSNPTVLNQISSAASGSFSNEPATNFPIPNLTAADIQQLQKQRQQQQQQLQQLELHLKQQRQQQFVAQQQGTLGNTPNQALLLPQALPQQANSLPSQSAGQQQLFNIGTCSVPVMTTQSVSSTMFEWPNTSPNAVDGMGQPTP